MSEKFKLLLESYTTILIKNGIYTVDGIQAAFKDFCDSLTIQEPKIKPLPNNNNANYIQTTLSEAIQRAKQPVIITVKKNENDDWESTVYPGMIFKEFPNETGDDTHYVCVGFKDGKNLQPLSMNQLRICQANGWRFDINNTIGCAKTVSTDLAVKL